MNTTTNKETAKRIEFLTWKIQWVTMWTQLGREHVALNRFTLGG